MKFIVKIQNKSSRCITLQIEIVVMVVRFIQAFKTEINFYKCVNNCLLIENHNSSLTESVVHKKSMAKKKIFYLWQSTASGYKIYLSFSWLI